MLPLLAGIAFAQAPSANIDHAELRRMLHEVAPEVEARAGRALVARPDVGILTRDKARQVLVMHLPTLDGRPARVEPGPLPPAGEAMVEGAIALYIPALEGVYLVKEKVEELVADLALSQKDLRAVVRCAVAHEVVHALQHQYGVPPIDLDRQLAPGLTALSEGHAVQLGQATCRETEGSEAAAFLDAAMGTDVPSSLAATDPSAAYAWGRVLADVLQQGDAESIWRALQAEPPTWEEVVEVVQPHLTEGWADPGALVNTTQQMEWSITGEQGPSSATLTLGTLIPHEVLAAHPTEAGQMLAQVEGDHFEILAAYLFRDEGGPAAIVANRTFQAKRWPSGNMLVLSASDAPVMALKANTGGPLAKRDDVSAALSVRVTYVGNDTYDELWIATDRVLIVAFSDAIPLRRKPNQLALAGLLDALPTSPGTATAEPPGWLDVKHPLDPGASWPYRLQQAARARAAGHEDYCSAGFADLFAAAPPAASPGMWEAAHQCATVAVDITRATAAYDRLEAPSTAAVTRQAALLSDTGSPSEALRLLQALPNDEDRDRASVKLVILARLRRWAELETLARTERPWPHARFNAGVDLWNARRRRPARDILKATCPLVEEASRPQCLATLARMR